MWCDQQLKYTTAAVTRSQIFCADIQELLAVRFHRASDLLQSSSSRGQHIPPRAAEEHGAILIGVAFQHRDHVDKTIKGSKP